MKAFFARSFRRRLFGAFLVVSLVPLLICSAMLLQIFLMRMSRAADESAREHMAAITLTMDELYNGFADAAAALQGNALISSALTGSEVKDTYVYNELFSAVAPVRDWARFDLYDTEGKWRYSTQNAPLTQQLSTNWGVLKAAQGERLLTFIATEDATDAQAPSLYAVAELNNADGQDVGYLLISMMQSNLRQQFDGSYGAQNSLLLLSEYWRPVYCSQPALTVSLAAQVRHNLITRQALNASSEDFLYSAEYNSATGMYVVLRQPQIISPSSMNLLYTVSLISALISIAISILMSLQVSKQMFSPIALLHRSIDEVEQNNLNAYVAHHQQDELGELAGRFNEMLDALKHNQEALVENQRQLDTAQIQMMQAQLNPHFLCNTLDTMKWISKINKVPQVAMMSTNLADILRFCISADEFVPLGLEAEVLSRYVEIQNIRMSDAFSFKVIIPEELSMCMVPKMILQPLVENAILHGLNGVENGSITVSAEKISEDAMQIRVSDSGRGLPPEKHGRFAELDTIPRNGHLGLYNVDSILRKYYGESFGLFLSSAPEGGAMIIATIGLKMG